MDASPRAAFGFGLVALAQSLYLAGGVSAGRIGLGTIVDASSALCAVACAYASWMGKDRKLLAGGLGVFALVQLVDYARSMSGAGIDAFGLGFTVVVAGLVVAAVAAWRWSTYGESMPRPVALRIGAALVALGSFSYILLGLMSGFGFGGVFGFGAISAAAGWSLVASAA